MKYTKKSTTIEAVQWVGDNLKEICDFVGKNYVEYDHVFGPFINSPEGVRLVRIGDYIIKNSLGEFYSCSPSIFEETYKRKSCRLKVTSKNNVSTKSAEEMFAELGYTLKEKDENERYVYVKPISHGFRSFVLRIVITPETVSFFADETYTCATVKELCAVYQQLKEMRKNDDSQRETFKKN